MVPRELDGLRKLPEAGGGPNRPTPRSSRSLAHIVLLELMGGLALLLWNLRIVQSGIIRQSCLMFAARITLAQLSISALMRVANSPGVLATTSKPSAGKRSFTSGKVR